MAIHLSFHVIPRHVRGVEVYVSLVYYYPSVCVLEAP